MRDRLTELIALSDSHDWKEPDVIIDLPATFYNIFYSQCEDITNTTERIRICVSDIKGFHMKILSAPTNDSNVKNELEKRLFEIDIAGAEIRTKLKNIENELSAMKASNAPENAEFRIKKSQFNFLTDLFKDIMFEFNMVQVEHRNNCKQRIIRQLEITGKNTNEEEIDRLLLSGNTQIFTENILLETKIAKQTLDEIEERHQDIIRLEKSIQELYDMFKDIAALVQAQGETIDNIEKNVSQSKDYVESAKTQTEQAVVYQSKARRKKIILIVVLVAIVLIVLAIIIGTLVQKFK